jgi:S-formylglutathione hydrolase FrmB
MIIVMPDANTGQRGYFNDISGKWRYEDFFFEELIPFVEKKYRVRSEKRYRAIAGLSMGGGGTFMYALRRPDLFSSACPLSAYVGPLSLEEARTGMRFAGDIKNIPDEVFKEYYENHNALSLINNWPEESKNKVRWYIDCGDDDFLYEGNSLVHIAMKKIIFPTSSGSGMAVTRGPTGVNHSPKCWDLFPKRSTSIKSHVYCITDGYFDPIVMPGQLSVLKGEAGKPSVFTRLASYGLLAHAYLTATGLVTFSLYTTTFPSSRYAFAQ